MFTSMAGERVPTSYATTAPGGRRSLTKRLNCSNTASGSWSGTRRNEIFADASDAITVLPPAPV